MQYNVDIKSLNCPNCGAQLVIPKNVTDIVFCSACGTKCVINGLNVNEELLKKNNINSGIPLYEVSQKIHDSIFAFITTSKNFPINVLEELEITRLHMISVPAYLFTVSAFASYTYEAGNERQQDTVVTDRNGNVVTKHKTYIEWTQMSAIANDHRTVIVCGNSGYMNVINNFYGNMNPGNLVDIEYLNYPEGTVNESFDVPYASAFSQYVTPAVESGIDDSARQTLHGKKYRNLAIGQANIQKEYEARVSLGIYIVDCKFNHQKFQVYFNADGSNYMATVKPPEDEARTSYIKNLKQNKKSIKSTFISDIFHGGFSKAKENSAAHKEEKNQIQQKINSVTEEPERAKAEFLNRKCRLKGIYSKGNDNFKWQTYNPDVPVMTSPFGGCEQTPTNKC